MSLEHYYIGKRILHTGEREIHDQTEINQFIRAYEQRVLTGRYRVEQGISNIPLHNETTLEQTSLGIVATVTFLEEHYRDGTVKERNLLSEPDISILHGTPHDIIENTYDGEGKHYLIKTPSGDLHIHSYAPSEVDHKQWTLEQLRRLKDGNLTYDESFNHYFSGL